MMKNNRRLRTYLASALLLTTGATFSATVSAALLGVSPLGLPLLNFNNTGMTGYDAATEAFTITADPLRVRFPLPPSREVFDPTANPPKSVTINVEVDSNGALVGGMPGDDLVVIGAVDTNGDSVLDADGVLLTGEVTAFGFEDSGGPTDLYDFRFTVTGGALAPFYAGQDIGVTVTSEGSSFTGSFVNSFGGAAKGNIGPIPPLPEACIEVQKEVSVDGGNTWYDADTLTASADDGNLTADLKNGAGAPGVRDMGAEYRIVVENCGTVDLHNVTLNDIAPTDPDLVPLLQNVNIGTLPAGQQEILTKDTSPDFEGLEKPGACDDLDPPAKVNTVKVTSTLDPGGNDPGPMDDDPAWITCQCVDVQKEVSVDGGNTWWDADTLLSSANDPNNTTANFMNVAGAPGTDLEAEYRIKVSNCGAVRLENVTLNDVDPTDPLVGTFLQDVNIGALDPGEMKTFTKADVPVDPDFGNLDQPGRCAVAEPPEKNNTVKVTTEVDVNGQLEMGPMDDDNSWVKCQCLEAQKEVSVDGGLTWWDADSMSVSPDDPDNMTADFMNSAGSPSTPLAAQYRVVLRNCGAVELYNVTLNDVAPTDPDLAPLLTNAVLPFSLAPGDEVTVTSGTGPAFENLDKPAACEDPQPPSKVNTVKATSTVDPAGNEMGPMDSDPAWIRCSCLNVQKEVSVDGGTTWWDADTVAASANDPDNTTADLMNLAGSPGTDLAAQYRIVVENCGAVDLFNVKLNDIAPTDPDLAPLLQNVNIGALPAGQQAVFTKDSGGAFADLDKPQACEDVDPPTKVNTIKATSEFDNGQMGPMDDDPAWIRCACVDIEKQVRVPDNGGFSPWFDADTKLTAPNTEQSAEYRFVVTNCGAVKLNNVRISDFAGGQIDPDTGQVLDTQILFNDLSIGMLEVGEAKTVFSDQIVSDQSGGTPTNDFMALDQPDRCMAVDQLPPNLQADGKLLNTVVVTSDEVDGNDDPAWVMCVPPPQCDLDVTKTCVIAEPPVNTLLGKCKGKIQEFTLITPAGAAGPVTLASSQLSFSNNPVQPGEEVTFFNNSGDNDVFVTLSGGLNGQSKFHMSCSDRDMNADNDNDVQMQQLGRSQDCGKVAGNGKDNNGGFVDNWIFEGLVDAEGLELDCTAPDPDPVEPVQCQFTPAPSTGGSCDDIKDITALTLIWDGPDGMNLVSEVGQVINGINNGDVIILDTPKNQTGNDVDVTLGGSVNSTAKFHISCSDDAMDGPEDCGTNQGNGKNDESDLNNQFLLGGMTGEQGSFSCAGIPGISDSVDVVYGFEVENLNNVGIEVRIVDSLLGIDQTETIAANDTLKLVTDPFSVTPDPITDVFKNTVVVTGETVSGATCEAMDMVEVKRNPPPPPPPEPVTCSDIKDITGLRLVWDGPDGVDVESEVGQVFTGVNNGDILLLDTPKDQTGNDVDIFLSSSVSGQSRFHISCSDDKMNGTEDCGLPQGNGKSDEGSLLNTWLLDGMTGENGSFNCNIPEATGVELPGSYPPGGGGGPGGGDVTGASSPDLGDNKKVKWELTNNGNSDVFITRVTVTWPGAHGQVKKFKFNGDFAKDVFDGSSPTTVPDDKAFETDANKRKIKKGETRKLEVEFTNSFGGHSQGDFTFMVEFDNGEVLSFP